MESIYSSVRNRVVSHLACAAALVTVPLTGCEGRNDVTLTIFAASSLREPVEKLAEAFEAAHPSAEFELQFLGSQQLVTQVLNGARADILLLANSAQVERLQTAGFSGEVFPFLSNELAVIAGSDVTRFEDLAKPGIKLVIAAPEVPAGSYTEQLLDFAGADSSFGPDFVDALRKRVVSLESNVRAAASKVRIGEADAAIVYRTDVPTGRTDGIQLIELPPHLQVPVAYFAVLLPEGAESELARGFLAGLKSDAARETFRAAGFSIP